MVPKEDSDPVYAYEFIGSKIEVTDSNHEGYIGLTGTVIDETKNTFVIRDKKDRTIPKEGVRFEVHVNNSLKTLNGSSIAYRPEDRIKKLG
ncbi:MAG: ribonuclease P protein subunit [Candidatus Thermoplasmatota archaeon]